MLTITKIFQFSAAHRLPSYEGKCQNLHGHTWRLEVTVKGSVKQSGPYRGMIVDFGILKDAVEKYILENHDHNFLNDLYENPTAEMMAQQIFKRLVRRLPEEVLLVNIRLWESDTAYVDCNANLG